MKEKELDNNYMSEVGDGQKRLSTDPVEVDTGLDAIIVSNVTQTLSGGMTIAAPKEMGDQGLKLYIPAGTPIVNGEGMILTVTDAQDLKSLNDNVGVIGIATRSFLFSEKAECVSVAKAAHVNVDALCDAIAESYKEFFNDESFDKDTYKEAYINGNWHKTLCLTFEQNF